MLRIGPHPLFRATARRSPVSAGRPRMWCTVGAPASNKRRLAAVFKIDSTLHFSPPELGERAATVTANAALPESIKTTNPWKVNWLWAGVKGQRDLRRFFAKLIFSYSNTAHEKAERSVNEEKNWCGRLYLCFCYVHSFIYLKWSISPPGGEALVCLSNSGLG